MDLSKTTVFNYSSLEFIMRILWGGFHKTLWRLLWHRLYFLRPLSLKIFGANVRLKSMMYGSTRIFNPKTFKMGEYSTLGPRVEVYNLGSVEIGSHTVISQDAYLCGGTHDYKMDGMPLVKADIVVGNRCWICAGAFLGPGVHIGDDVIVGARAVVTKNIPNGAVVVGNPGAVIKIRNL
ncbi:putative colanic acid biosynthesis acetyltransferase [Pseudomonadota bacterium]